MNLPARRAYEVPYDLDHPIENQSAEYLKLRGCWRSSARQRRG